MSLLLAQATPVSAQSVGARHQHPAAHTPIEVRLGLSKRARARFAVRRFRRYLSLELDGVGSLSSSLSGPLDQHVCYVWLDRPTPLLVRLQVQLGSRGATSRQIRFPRPMREDVVARVVALRTAETIRRQIKRPAPQRCALSTHERPQKRCPRKAGRAKSTVHAGATTVALQPWGRLLVGPTLAAGFSMDGLEQQLYFRALTLTTGKEPGSWFEAGAGAHMDVWRADRWHVDVGALAGLAVVRMPGSVLPSPSSTESSGWTARTAIRLGTTRDIGNNAGALSLVLEPGWLLRDLTFAHADGTHRTSWQGGWVGVSLIYSQTMTQSR